MPIQNTISARRFTLLLGPEASTETRCDISMVRFGADFKDTSEWQSVTGLPNSGAVLIRPDGHIAARLEQVERIDELMQQLLMKGA